MNGAYCACGGTMVPYHHGGLVCGRCGFRCVVPAVEEEPAPARILFEPEEEGEQAKRDRLERSERVPRGTRGPSGRKGGPK